MKLSTMKCLRMGVLDKPIPKTDIPDKEHKNVEWEWGYVGTDQVKKWIENGLVAYSANYYGMPHIWKEDKKYRIVMLQYREVTEDETIDDLEEAIERFEDLCGETGN